MPQPPQISSDEAEERAQLWRVLDESLNEIYLFAEEDLRFRYVNQGAIGNLGYSLERMQGMTPVDIKPGFTREAFEAKLAPLRDESERKLVFETVHKRADGSLYPVLVHLQLVPGKGSRSFLAIINDITERERQQQELRSSEARFRALVEHSRDLLLLFGPDRTFSFVGASVTSVLGFTSEEVLAMLPPDIVHPDDVPTAQAHMEATYAGESTKPVDLRFRHKLGSYRTLSVQSRNLLGDPAIKAAVINARDVTEERKLEAQLRESGKLESLGRLAGGIAHDFNNLLTTILSTASFLREEVDGAEALQDVAEIERAAQRAAALTEQLLAFARKGIIRPRVVDLGALVLETRRFLQRVLGERIVLSAVVDESCAVRIDPSQLEQVILNLALNARDAMAGAGRLDLIVDVPYLHESALPEGGGLAAGPYGRLLVRDSGVGIAPEHLPRVFEPFFTTKPIGQGTGLGLATVYGIVKQNTGHIRVSSTLGGGTTFEVFFPLSTDRVTTPSKQLTSEVRRGTETVLVVEDDEAVRRSVVRTLKAAGYDVHSVTQAIEAEAWAMAHREDLRLLVTDVVMPEISGVQVAARVLAHCETVKVLYISGYNEETLTAQAELPPGVRYLSKPFAPDVLLARARELLDEQIALPESR